MKRSAHAGVAQTVWFASVTRDPLAQPMQARKL
jgi:hypothetical protein